MASAAVYNNMNGNRRTMFNAPLPAANAHYSTPGVMPPQAFPQQDPPSNAPSWASTAPSTVPGTIHLHSSPKKVKAYGGKAQYEAYQTGIGIQQSAVRLWMGRLVNLPFMSRKAIRRNKRELACWSLLACVVLLAYKFFSDGSFSAILTLASIMQLFAFTLLLSKVDSQCSVAGVSLRSLALCLVNLTFRLMSTLFFNGYLPVDKSGDWVYQLADILSVVLIITLFAWAYWYCKPSIAVQREKDTCHVVIPVIVSAVLATLIHPTLNQWGPADIAWTFALYVETIAMVPQLFMMGKVMGEVEALTSHYVACMGASKVFACLFWYFSYQELAPKDGFNMAGWAVLMSYVIQVVLLIDFLYYYIKSMRLGKRLIINL